MVRSRVGVVCGLSKDLLKVEKFTYLNEEFSTSLSLSSKVSQ